MFDSPFPLTDPDGGGSAPATTPDAAPPVPEAPEPLVRVDDARDYAAALAAYRRGTWDDGRWTTFRLRNGVYAQKQPGMHMVRAKIPGGRLSFDQARTIAAANRRYCGGDAHITTRQDIQLYFVTLEATAGLLEALALGGVTTREAAGNTLRNTTACPLAGVCPHEHVDAGAVAERLATAWLRHPLVQHMPRKFKTAVSGCGHDCGLTAIDDLGFIATVKDGRPGFRVVAGGGLGAKPLSAVPVLDFVTEDELPAVQEAAARLHQRYSNRKKKMASRLKFLVERFGEAEFVRLFREAFETARPLPRRPWRPLAWREPTAEAAPPPLPGAIVAQHDGATAVVIRPPLGNLDSDRLERLTDLAEIYGASGFRLTRDQNIIAVGLAADRVAPFVAGVRALGLDVAERDTGLGNVAACPGTHTCPIGITNSHALATAILDDAPALADRPELRVRISGCPNSCGQHHVGDVGLHGLAKKIDGRIAPHYQLHLGGDGTRPGAIAIAGPEFPAAHAKAVLAAVVRAYDEQRAPGETVRAWAERIGEDAVTALVHSVVAADAPRVSDLHVDWGETGPFFPPVTAAGECGQPVVVGEFLGDLARTAHADMDRYRAVGNPEGARTAAAEAIGWAGRRILLVRGITARSPDDLHETLRGHIGGDAALAGAYEAALAARDAAADDDSLAALGGAVDAWIEAAEAAVERALAVRTMVGIPA